MIPRLRLAFAVLSFLAGAYLLVTGEVAGAGLIAASAYLGYGYFKYGTVWLAFRAVAQGNMVEAAQLLQKVKAPERLDTEQRAYFELASGLVCASRAQNQQAERHLQNALDHRLRTDNDRALAEAVLAQLLVARDALDAARAVIARAVKRECRPSIAARIKTLHEQLQREASA